MPRTRTSSGTSTRGMGSARTGSPVGQTGSSAAHEGRPATAASTSFMARMNATPCDDTIARGDGGGRSKGAGGGLGTRRWWLRRVSSPVEWPSRKPTVRSKVGGTPLAIAELELLERVDAVDTVEASEPARDSMPYVAVYAVASSSGAADAASVPVSAATGGAESAAKAADSSESATRGIVRERAARAET